MELHHITETDVVFMIHHEDHATFITAFVPVAHQQMSKITTAWFDNLTKDEQRAFIEQLQCRS
jgi:hypothetical protein